MSKKAKADLDDGYTRIANSIMQALYALPISNREMRVLLFIIYQTYGYNHKERELSNSYIGQGVGLSQSHTSETVQKLLKAKIIKQELSGRRGAQILRLNTRLSEWATTPEKGSRTTPEKGSRTTPEKGSRTTPEKGSRTTPEKGSRTTPEIGKQYNTDKYNTEQNKTECSGSTLPRHTLTVFDRLWADWKFSQAGIDHVSRKQRSEIEKNGYLRMTDARLRYEKYFSELTTKNNVPLSARTWFNGSYTRYLPDVDSEGFWYNINNKKCKGDVCYE